MVFFHSSPGVFKRDLLSVLFGREVLGPGASGTVLKYRSYLPFYSFPLSFFGLDSLTEDFPLLNVILKQKLPEKFFFPFSRVNIRRFWLFGVNV